MPSKEYVRPMPATWWLHNIYLKLFMIRELTSVFVAGYAVFLIILITSIFAKAGLVQPGKLFDIFGHPLGRLFLFVVISLPLFHWAHRFRFTLVDLGLKALKGPIAILCYGAAMAGTLIAAVLLVIS